MAADRLDRLTELAQRRLGINLNRAGLGGALERFAQRFAALDGHQLPDADELESDTFQSLVDAVTVQHSWLFRDRQQLEVACSTLAPSEGESRLRRVWVPACATGEDVYSIAALCDAMRLNVEILGTDVNAVAIEQARRGRYGDASVRHVPPIHRSMLRTTAQGHHVVGRFLERARFEIHNLLETAPRSSAPSGRWDLIVCRNVLIYFTTEHTTRTLELLRDALAPGGTLVLGASDILTQLPASLAPREVGERLVFQRVGDEVVHEPSHRTPNPSGFSTTPKPPAFRQPIPLNRLPSLPVLPLPDTLRTILESGPIPSSRRSLELPAIPSAPPSLAPDSVPETDLDEAAEHLLAGIERHLAGELQAALRELRAALFLEPRLWPASYYLALTFEGLGRDEDARRAYLEVSRHIEQGAPLPTVDGHDFEFLQRDVAAIARRRART